MKRIIFDTGPIISLTLNNLLWMLKPLKERYKGEFCITTSVRRELVDHPLTTKKFKFEAMQVLRQIKEGVLTEVDDKPYQADTKALLDLANTSFRFNGRYLNILHQAEVTVLAVASRLKAEAIVVDEQTTRLLLENPTRMEDRLKKRFHHKASQDEKKLSLFQKRLSNIRLLRSTELVGVAFEFGIFDCFLPDSGKVENHPDQELLESLLWGLKLKGCAISEREINQIMKIEEKRKR